MRGTAVPDADETEVQTDQTAEEEQTTDDDAADDDRKDDADDKGETFPRSYVEKLRTEAKDNRKRYEVAETRVQEISRQLFTLRVQATQKLADPTDLEYNPDLLGDDDRLD